MHISKNRLKRSTVILKQKCITYDFNIFVSNMFELLQITSVNISDNSFMQGEEPPFVLSPL